MILAVMKLSVYSTSRRHPNGDNLAAEFRRYRVCGWMLLILNIVLSGITGFIISRNTGFSYPGHMIFVYAAFAFYTITLASVNLKRYRRFNSPLLSASAVISMTGALVTMLSLETALIDRFGSGDPSGFRAKIIGITGMCIFLIVSAMSIYMILRATRFLNRYEKEKE